MRRLAHTTTMAGATRETASTKMTADFLRRPVRAELLLVKTDIMCLHRYPPQHLSPPFAGSPDRIGRTGFGSAVLRADSRDPLRTSHPLMRRRSPSPPSSRRRMISHSPPSGRRRSPSSPSRRRRSSPPPSLRRQRSPSPPSSRRRRSSRSPLPRPRRPPAPQRRRRRRSPSSP